jgi:hypothetical protein
LEVEFPRFQTVWKRDNFSRFKTLNSKTLKFRTDHCAQKTISAWALTPLLNGFCEGRLGSMSFCAESRWRILSVRFQSFIASLGFAFTFFLLCATTSAQVNSWTKTSSGNWEESFWSLGELPGVGQSVMITNANWKSVMIGPNTTANFPESLTMNSLTISSPTNSNNTLLLNYAGFATPLTVNSLLIASNSALTMLSSALQLNGPEGVGMSIGGEFNQNDFSVVAGNQIDIGYVGPGIYNFNSGVLDVSHVWLGAPFGGVFNQNGGSISNGIFHLEGGEYDLRDGDFGAMVYFDGGTFRQLGGSVNAPFTMFRGTYLMEGGINTGGVTVPSSDGWTTGGASVLQTGGTNFGAIHLGEYGSGFYTLSNAVVDSPEIDIEFYGNFFQWNGSVSSAAKIQIAGGWVNRGDRALGYYTLAGGNLSSPGIQMDTGSFTQENGTNDVAGDLELVSSTHNFYYLDGGLLKTENTQIESAWVGGFYQTGGAHVIANQLTIQSSDLDGFEGYVMSGGELIVSNIILSANAKFTQTGGAISQTGVLTLLAANFQAGPGEQHFGQLQLSAVDDATNSIFSLTAGACALRFAASGDLVWSNQASLKIQNWAGSLTGGGNQQIIFGNDASALTAKQLSQIAFLNPVGAPPGIYPAKILSTGEIVPQTFALSGSLPAIRLLPQLDGAMRITLRGQAGGNFMIEVSTNLVDWQFWTNQTATNGNLSILDNDAKNHPVRFYRATGLSK